MKFMTMVKSSENNGPPPAAMMEAIAEATKFVEVHKKHWPGWEGETEIRQIYDQPGA